MSKPRTITVSELVLDYGLYPRHHIDTSNVTTIGQAIDAGEQLPAVVADLTTKRVTDGFHRCTAHMRRDPSTKIPVTFVDYPDEQAMFLDAVRRNARHGVKLTSYDRARVALLGEQLAINTEALAEALAIDVDVMERMKRTRTAYDEKGKPLTIKRNARHLAGTKLTERQQRAVKRTQGWPLSFHCDQIVNAIEGDLVDWSDPANAEAVGRLRDAIAAY